MELPQLTGAQKTRLRGLGQTLEPSLKIGQAGVTHAVTRELQRLLEAHELVKVRFIGADRDVRATLAATLATEVPCLHAGSVGSTALFYPPPDDTKRRQIEP